MGSVVLCVCLGLCVVVVAIVRHSRGCGGGWVGHRHQPSVLCGVWSVCGCVWRWMWVIMFVVMAMFVVVVGVVVVVCVSFSVRIRVCEVCVSGAVCECVSV